MTPINDNWARISAVVSHAQLTTNSFAHHIGLPSGENLYRIKRGMNGISRDLAEKITRFYPEINIGWLLTGYGSMFVDEAQLTSQIPFFRGNQYDILMGYNKMQPEYNLFIPSIGHCDLALEMSEPKRARRTGDKTIYLLKKSEEKTFAAGREYISVKENCITLHKLPKRPRITGLKTEDFDIVYIVRGKLVFPDESVKTGKQKQTRK